jgi:23S rRNA pseudouridine1911/1915/1917 synthase
LKKKITELQPNSKIKLKIVFENEDFWIINKESSLQVHPSYTEKNETLINALLNLKPELKNVGEDWERLGIVHRLDKDTSGLMIVAKNNETFFELKKMFQEKKVKKTYQALVWGKMEKEKDLIDLPIAKNTSHQKQKIAQGKFSGQAREAQTEYQVLQNFTFSLPEKFKSKNIENAGDLFDEEKNKVKLSLLEVTPKTGRTHQIRIHLSHLNHPLVQDEKYYKKIHQQLNLNLNSKHQTFYLHSSKIEFELKNQKFSFSTPLPNYFLETLKILDKCKNNVKN